MPMSLFWPLFRQIYGLEYHCRYIPCLCQSATNADAFDFLFLKNCLGEYRLVQKTRQILVQLTAKYLLFL